MAIRSIKDIVGEAKAEIDNISPEEALRRSNEEGAQLVDIRDVRELQREGTLDGGMHAPRGMLEFWVAPDSPYAKEAFAADREFILCCASGWRSALSAKMLQDMGMEKVSHIETGFKGWSGDGMPVVDYDTWKQSSKK